MNSHFTAGFGSELIKEARFRAGVKKLMAQGKDYMRRRTLAKQLGVRPADVDRVLAIQAKKVRRRKILQGMAGLGTAGALGVGSAIGSKRMTKLERDEL